MRRMIPKNEWDNALKNIEQLKDFDKKSVVFYEVDNIQALTDDECNKLRCGDVLLKKTENQRHAYRVSYKEDGVGMCLTYVDCENAETIAYDYTGGHWVFNSKDVTALGGHTDAEVKALAVDAVEEAVSGTLQEVLGLDSSGNLKKGSVSGGTKLYKHSLAMQNSPTKKTFKIATADNSITFDTTTSNMSKIITIICTRAEKILSTTDYQQLGEVLYVRFAYSTSSVVGIRTSYSATKGFYLSYAEMDYNASNFEFGEVTYPAGIASDTVTEL